MDSLNLRVKPTPPSPIVLEKIVALALDEDIARGDLTTSSVVSEDATGTAEVRAREPLVWCGFPVLDAVFSALKSRETRVEVSALEADGTFVDKGTAVARLSGPARQILLGERVALNFLQRMCAISTTAKTYVDALPGGSTCRIADTRKTTPGLRALERYAVLCGGAHNHRWDLSSAVMIKDNHIAACGGDVKLAIARARQNAPHTTRIECEVDRMDQLEDALVAGADIIMLDNFDNDAVKEALVVVERLKTRPTIIEASGGITLERVSTLGALVDVISVGALTHSAGSVDLGLDWMP